MDTLCRVCGLHMAQGDICTVCEIGEAGGMVKVWFATSWTSSIFATDEDCGEMPEPTYIIPAQEFAEFVRVERGL